MGTRAPYEPTVAERAENHAKKQARKKLNPQKWRDWCEELDEDDELETQEPKDAAT